MKVKSLSRVRLLATPWTAAYQAPPSMGFSREEYWSGLPLPSLVENMEDIQLIFAEWMAVLEGRFRTYKKDVKAIDLDLGVISM